MGTWDSSNGVQLVRRTNRWDRRTDLMGAKFVNAFGHEDVSAYHIYNNNGTLRPACKVPGCKNYGTVAGSGGIVQEKLVYDTITKHEDRYQGPIV